MEGNKHSKEPWVGGNQWTGPSPGTLRPRSRGQVPPPDSCCGGSRRVPGQHQQMARCPEGCWAQPLDPTATHSRSSQTLGGAPSWCRQQALLGFAFLVKIQEWEGKMLEHAEPPSLVCPGSEGVGGPPRLHRDWALSQPSERKLVVKIPPNSLQRQLRVSMSQIGTHGTVTLVQHRVVGTCVWSQVVWKTGLEAPLCVRQLGISTGW